MSKPERVAQYYAVLWPAVAEAFRLTGFGKIKSSEFFGMKQEKGEWRNEQARQAA